MIYCYTITYILLAITPFIFRYWQLSPPPEICIHIRRCGHQHTMCHREMCSPANCTLGKRWRPIWPGQSAGHDLWRRHVWSDWPEEYEVKVEGRKVIGRVVCVCSSERVDWTSKSEWPSYVGGRRWGHGTNYPLLCDNVRVCITLK